MIGDLLLLALAALFLATAASKVFGHKQFLSTVRAYRGVPGDVAPIVATVVIVGEFAGALLAIGPEPWGRTGLLLLAAIAGCGAVLATVDILVGNTQHPCGCFGSDSTGRLQWWHPLRSALVAFAAAALAVLVAPTASTLSWQSSVLLLLGLAVTWAALLATLQLQQRFGSRLSRNG